MIKAFVSFSFIALSLVSEARQWKNHANKSFEADYISNDGNQVTLRQTLRGKKKIITFSISKLHKDDQAWLKKNHPFNPNENPIQQVQGAAFDTLEFGDSKEEVIKKLRKSKLVDGDVVEAFLARTGMNGIYKTKKAIGGLHCHLYFEWANNSLREVSFRTEPLAERLYGTDLKKNWNEWIKLFSMLYGKPAQDGDYPDINDLEDGLMLGSHIWHTEEGHSVILGSGQDGNKYSAVVRITSEHIQPNRL